MLLIIVNAGLVVVAVVGLCFQCSHLANNMISLHYVVLLFVLVNMVSSSRLFW